MRLASLAAAALVSTLSFAATSEIAHAYGDEPYTSTIRIRLKGPTLRVRCRGGDCVVSIVRTGTTFAVSVTRTRNGVPFTFERSVENPTNVAVETGTGNDDVTLVDVVVPGFLRIGTGNGDDVLRISDTSTAQKVSIGTGPGNDTVHLSPGAFGGKFHLKTNGGDDEVTVEGGSFQSTAGFDGGTGSDGFSADASQFTVSPVLRGFEH
jgi:hypothetical protein